MDFSLYDLQEIGSAEDYWKKIFTLKNHADMPLFKNLKVVLGFLLVLPFSNVSVERTFSAVYNIKTEYRNKLNTETLCSILHTKQGIKNVGGAVQFEPDTKMLRKSVWTSRDNNKDN